MNSSEALVREVLVHGPISRTDLAQRLDLSAPSLTRLARPYLEHGVFRELDDVVDGSRGRPQRPLDITPDLTRFVGVKITGDAAFGVVTTMRAEVLDEQVLPLEGASPEAVAARVAELVEILVGRTGGRSVHAIGVCLGGNVLDERLVTRAPFLGWRDVDLATTLERLTGLRTVVANDVVALAAAHQWFGLARNVADFAVVTIGAGVGYALVSADRLVLHPDTGLGLAGHLPLGDAGPICDRGHRGCTSVLASIPGMLGQYELATGRAVGYDELLDEAASGREPAVAIVTAASRALGQLLALVSSLAMTTTIVLGGDGIALWQRFSDPALDVVAHGRDPDASPLDLRVDPMGFGAWARGAAAIAIQASLGRLAAR
ncbi:MAG: ROK family protein [Salana multivorans]|uniref:ROK family protein n=1 Tax=Salana multivorans TaxID=120377 RepID=UPI000959A8E9|nr:ROK family protein [Salana multivorans]MBN8881786.1 ROK family protein [Salana multivorans]OJX94635.1 MAG: hypothetical protein BGO96_00660 [Micrococcales bacterium 73-15]